MKAAVYDRYGSPEVLSIREVPRPLIGPTQVLVRVRTTSVNPKDAVVRSGKFRWLSGRKFPQIPGSDFCGSVHEVGERVIDLRVGQDVFGYLGRITGGASAEYVAARASGVALKPFELDDVTAAALPCAHLTALQALRDKGRISSGHEVLVYGASGGVGTAAVQLARHFGARVTSVSSSRNVEYCLENGADRALAYDRDEVFASGRYDIVFQVYQGAGSVHGQARWVLARGGVFVTTGFGPRLLLDGLAWRVWGLRLANVIVKSRRVDLELLARLALEGRITPRVERQLPLEGIVEAHRLIESGHTRGKIVVRVG